MEDKVRPAGGAGGGGGGGGAAAGNCLSLRCCKHTRVCVHTRVEYTATYILMHIHIRVWCVRVCTCVCVCTHTPYAYSCTCVVCTCVYVHACVHTHKYIGDEMFEWEVEPRDIKLGKLLGSGSFGDVYKGSWLGADVAIKRLRCPPFF